jgi:hypothetical protein
MAAGRCALPHTAGPLSPHYVENGGGYVDTKAPPSRRTSLLRRMTMSKWCRSRSAVPARRRAQMLRKRRKSGELYHGQKHQCRQAARQRRRRVRRWSEWHCEPRTDRAHVPGRTGANDGPERLTIRAARPTTQESLTRLHFVQYQIDTVSHRPLVISTAVGPWLTKSTS